VKAGVTRIRLHDLRHATATHLINQGYNLKQIQDYMRHADAALTSDIYGHLYESTKLEMATAIRIPFSTAS